MMMMIYHDSIIPVDSPLRMGRGRDETRRDCPQRPTQKETTFSLPAWVSHFSLSLSLSLSIVYSSSCSSARFHIAPHHSTTPHHKRRTKNNGPPLHPHRLLDCRRIVPSDLAWSAEPTAERWYRCLAGVAAVVVVVDRLSRPLLTPPSPLPFPPPTPHHITSRTDDSDC